MLSEHSTAELRFVFDHPRGLLPLCLYRWIAGKQITKNSIDVMHIGVQHTNTYPRSTRSIARLRLPERPPLLSVPRWDPSSELELPATNKCLRSAAFGNKPKQLMTSAKTQMIRI